MLTTPNLNQTVSLLSYERVHLCDSELIRVEAFILVKTDKQT